MRDSVTYAANLLATVFTYSVFVFVFSRLWSAAYADKAEIAGYARDQVVWYFIVAELASFGMGRFFWRLVPGIRDGSVAYALARPTSWLGQNWASLMGKGVLDTVVLLVAGTALGLLFAGTPVFLDPARLPVLLLMLLAGGTLQFFVHALIAMTAFAFEENSAFFWIYQKVVLVAGTLVPLEFLPDAAREVAKWTPVPWITWAPARFASVPGTNPWPLLAGQCAWIAVAMAASALAFRAARRKMSVNGG
jgi:ABC-2 type transport system permease protein